MTTFAPALETTLRAYTPADRPAVRRIACLTAFRNRGHAAVLPDADLFADYWTRYYTDFEPERLIIAELTHDSRTDVVGYLTGCGDTQRYVRVMAREVMPSVLRRLARHAVKFASGDGHRARTLLRWMCTRAWREAPRVDIHRFPAHYHANLLHHGAGYHLYTRMAVAFIDQLEQFGVTSLHGQVTEWRDRGAWDRMVQRFMTRGASTVATTSAPSTMQRDLFGESRAMVNRSISANTRDFRDLLVWARDHYGL